MKDNGIPITYTELIKRCKAIYVTYPYGHIKRKEIALKIKEYEQIAEDRKSKGKDLEIKPNLQHLKWLEKRKRK